MAIPGLQKLVLASNNAGKLREFSALLAPLGIELATQASLGVDEAEEPYPSFLENALAKARHACFHTGLPALADDSGLCVMALNGAPGVHSARYAGEPRSDAANNAKLVRELASQADRRAYYHCVLVLMRHADDPQPIVAEASWQGEILAAPRGTGGFGYDAHFLLPDLGLTAAEMAADVKNQVSHRGRAMQDLLRQLA